MTQPTITPDPVFLAMTRPIMVLGVPFLYFFLEFSVCIIVFLLTKNFWTLCVAGLLHGLGYTIALKEPHFIGIFQQRLKVHYNPNYRYWQASSYAQ